MPELPEVETVRTSLEGLVGQKLSAVSVRDRRLRYRVPPNFGAAVLGKKLLALERTGKYLLWKFPDHQFVFHLGMTGRLLINQKEDSPYLKLRFVFSRDSVDFIDVRRFAFALEGAAVLPAMPRGIDALALRVSHLLKSKIRSSTSAIKNLLLDQSIVAGLGNIYVAELLFDAGIDPRRQGKSLSDAELSRIAKACRAVLRRAVRAKGSSISDYVYSLPGEKAFSTGSYQKQFRVYSRAGQGCPRCNNLIMKIVQGGRSTFFCPRCQS